MSYWQELMDIFYKQWQATSGKQQNTFNHFSKEGREDINSATRFGNLNQQVTNNGLDGWFGNGYWESYDGIVEDLKKGVALNIPLFSDMLKVVEELQYAILSMQEGDTVECNYCDGRGYSEEECWDCDGSGTVTYHDGEEDPCKCGDGKETFDCEYCDCRGETDVTEYFSYTLDGATEAYFKIDQDKWIASVDQFLKRYDEEIPMPEKKKSDKPLWKVDMKRHGDSRLVMTSVKRCLERAGQKEKAEEWWAVCTKTPHDMMISAALDFVEMDI